MKRSLDLSSYLVIGPENTLGRPLGDIVRGAVRAGFTCVQVRAKQASAREFIACTREAAKAIAAEGKAGEVVLLVNDRLDVALAARMQGIPVDGVHMGQKDIPVDICRKLLGEDAIVGLSARRVNLLDYIRTVDASVIDYFGAGPLHETMTKTDTERDEQGHVITRSFAELQELARISPVPVVVGGGVTASDLPRLAATGVDGFFVISAVAGAERPEEAARKLVEEWRKQRAS